MQNVSLECKQSEFPDRLSIIQCYQIRNRLDSICHVMDGSLPNSLKHIISNAKYYGPFLFLLATDVVINYVFQVIFIPFSGIFDCELC